MRGRVVWRVIHFYIYSPGNLTPPDVAPTRDEVKSRNVKMPKTGPRGPEKRVGPNIKRVLIYIQTGKELYGTHVDVMKTQM